jgi:hypothetical protein
LLTAKFYDARPLRPFFFRFYNRSSLSLPLLWSLNIDRALGCNFKCKGHASETEKDPVAHFRSLMGYPAIPRERGLGWMARRKRRACPQLPVRSEERSRTAQNALALWVAPLCRFSSVAPRLQTGAGMRPPRALEKRKIGSNAAWLGISTGS